MAIYLVNWTHLKNNVGGSERRYSLLKKVFPSASLISANDLTPHPSLDKRGNAVDIFLLKNTNKTDIVIKDAGVGFAKLKARKILIYGNPYKSLIRHFPNHPALEYWEDLISFQKQDARSADFSIANSTFSKQDAKLSEAIINQVIPNGVDTTFWKPKKSCTKKYVLWVGSLFKETGCKLNFTQLSKKISYPIKVVYKEDNYSVDQMLKLYQHALFYFNPFPVEGNSNAILEAMSCDLPIVCHQTGLFWDRDIKDVGFYSNGAAIQLVDVLKKLIQQVSAFNPRAYIMKQKLTEKQYIENMQEAVYG